MLPDLSPAHILIVVIVALVVVGPKDLPMLLRKIGQFMGKMRGMANEFRASFDEMARQSELDELRKEVEAMRAAANASTPDLGIDSDLGLTAALHADAESSYLQEWQASQSLPEAEQSILPPADAKPAKGGKAKPSSAKAPSKTASTKTKSAKPAAASPKTSAKAKASAPAKPAAKKTKSGTAS